MFSWKKTKRILKKYIKAQFYLFIFIFSIFLELHHLPIRTACRYDGLDVFGVIKRCKNRSWYIILKPLNNINVFIDLSFLYTFNFCNSWKISGDWIPLSYMLVHLEILLFTSNDVSNNNIVWKWFYLNHRNDSHFLEIL